MRKFSLFFLAVAMLVSNIVLAESKRDFRQQQRDKWKTHKTTQKAENKAFRESLEGKTGQERHDAIEAHRTQQVEENKALRDEMHKENMDALKTRLDKNSKLTEEQKAQILEKREKKYQEQAERQKQRQEENRAFVEKVKNDPNLTSEQRKAAIKEHMAAQKKEAKEARLQRKAERQEQRKAKRRQAGSEGQEN